MVHFIVRLFIKDHNNTGNSKVREQYGNLASGVGIFSNLLLFVMKVTTGLLFNSISIVADAVNNFADMASSVVTLLGFRLSSRPADKNHPFGHARYEYIAGLIVSFAILFIGLELVKTSVKKIISPEPITFSWITLIILTASILIKMWQSHFNKTIGQLINSLALEATAADSRNDVISTAAVLISTIVSALTGWQLDGFMGVLVAFFIIYSGITLIKETINPLLGTIPDKELVDQIQQKITTYEGIIGHHDLIVHDYGPGRCFASFHAEVPRNQDVMLSHDIIDRMEADFLRDMNLPVVIHMDPIDTDDVRTKQSYAVLDNIVKKISPDLAIHDFRVVTGPTHSNLIFDLCVDFDLPIEDAALIQMIKEKVHEHNDQWHCVIKVNRSFV
jgi:cation diffusion facilitator family transporter